MGTTTRPLSKAERLKIRRFYADDGIKRFTIGGKALSYSEAYNAILSEEGATIGEKSEPGSTRNVYPREAIRRLGKLNDAYWSAARPFIVANPPPKPPPTQNEPAPAPEPTERPPEAP